ncbi:hypothetical protein EES46_19755 [Streptomyces sp. ADI98-10]|nr:hypothetical protein EES46_19755 [Streptomyces sp. ADI98-10]
MDFEIREDRKPQGARKLAKERAAYFQLMQQGVSGREACRILGINRRTGQRWSNGRNPSGRNKAAPPVTTVVPPSPLSRYLCQEERVHIADRLREKATVRAIAASWAAARPRSAARSTATAPTAHATSGTTAHTRRRPERTPPGRPRPKPRKLSRNPELRDAVQVMLDEKWSPEQTYQALRQKFPDRPEMHVVHETVYQALYVQGRGQLRARARRGPALGTGPPSAPTAGQLPPAALHHPDGHDQRTAP